MFSRKQAVQRTEFPPMSDWLEFIYAESLLDEPTEFV